MQKDAWPEGRAFMPTHKSEKQKSRGENPGFSNSDP
jgi:hypothetical protein